MIVLRRNGPQAYGRQFDLVCGVGRLEILIALGKATEASCEELNAPCSSGECR
jgi:hypothetical protein